MTQKNHITKRHLVFIVVTISLLFVFTTPAYGSSLPSDSYIESSIKEEVSGSSSSEIQAKIDKIKSLITYYKKMLVFYEKAQSGRKSSKNSKVVETNETKNALITSNINNMRAQAEIFGSKPDGTLNYAGVCSDTTMLILLSRVDKTNSGTTYCRSTKDEWVVSTKLLTSKKIKKKDTYYCVDSTGSVGTTSRKAATNATQCSPTP